MASDLVKQDTVFRWVSSVNRIKCSSDAVGLCPTNGNSLFQRHTQHLSFLSMHVSLTRSASIVRYYAQVTKLFCRIHPSYWTSRRVSIHLYCTWWFKRNVCAFKKIFSTGLSNKCHIQNTPAYSIYFNSGF